MYLVYTTFPDKESAIRLANMLVELDIVACVNIQDQSLSIYKWQGKVAHEQEAIMFCKTPGWAIDKVIAKIESEHPYDTPCVIAIDIKKGSKKFIKWVETCSEIPY